MAGGPKMHHFDGRRALNAPFSWPAGLKRCLSPGHKPANSEPKSGAETRLAGGPKTYAGATL